MGGQLCFLVLISRGQLHVIYDIPVSGQSNFQHQSASKSWPPQRSSIAVVQDIRYLRDRFDVIEPLASDYVSCASHRLNPKRGGKIISGWGPDSHHHSLKRSK